MEQKIFDHRTESHFHNEDNLRDSPEIVNRKDDDLLSVKVYPTIGGNLLNRDLRRNALPLCFQSILSVG